jgi:outer membrane protein, heavy metal efflux system
VWLRPVLVVALVVPASQAIPQESISEAEFVAPFLADHPTLIATSERLTEAEAALARASVLANPRLAYELENPEESRQTTVGLAWVPPLDGRRGLATAAARAGVSAAQAERALRLIQLRLAARAAYADWATARERYRTLGELFRVVDVVSTRMATRARAGEESGLAARRIALTAATLAGELAASQAALARAEATARAWRPDLPVAVAPTRPSLSAAIVPPPGVRWIDALEKELEQARLEERLAGRFWSAPELQAGWQRLDAGGTEMSGPVFSATVALPLFDRNKGGRTAATRRRMAAEARFALASAAQASRLAGAEASFRTLADAARAAETSANGVESLVEAATASFTAGESTVTDLLDVLRSALDARTRAVDAHAAALAAGRTLESTHAGLELGAAR